MAKDGATIVCVGFIDPTAKTFHAGMLSLRGLGAFAGCVPGDAAFSFCPVPVSFLVLPF